MKNKKTLLILVAVVLVAAIAVAAVLLSRGGKKEAATLLEQVKEKGKITFATEGDWAPWTYHDTASNELVGFDVEVARAVAEKMGVKAEFVECPWESIFMGIDSKMYDVAANGVEIIEERAAKYDFTVPYAYLRTALIVRGDNEDIKAFEDLKGKKTANSAGSTYALTAEGYGAETVVVSTLAQTLDLVISGSADATLNAELSFYDYMKEHPEANLKIVALSEEASQVAVPVRKGAENETFLAALNDAINALRADGTLKAISEKYFDTDITAAPAK